MPTHHSPSTLQSPLRHLHTGSGSSHGGSPVFVAAKPRQANRCWPRAYLIPPGIILILVSHAFDPTDCNPRYRAPVTLPPPLLLWARRSKDDCARSSCRHPPPCSRRKQRRRGRARRIAAQAEVVPCCRGTTLGDGDKLVLLVVLVTCRSASTSISPPSARRRKKQHCSRRVVAVARHYCCIWQHCSLLTNRARARSPLQGEGSESNSWPLG